MPKELLRWLEGRLHRDLISRDDPSDPTHYSLNYWSRFRFLDCFPTRWTPRRKSIFSKVIVIALSTIVWRFAVTHVYTIHHPAHFLSAMQHPQIREDATHHIFQSLEPSLTRGNPLNIRAYDSMTDACLEEWIVHHKWGSACIGTDLSEGLKVDGVWAWVNGSDPLQIASRQQFRPAGKMKMDAVHRYQTHNELLFSMRSALDSMDNYTMQRLHILASAYHVQNGNEGEMAGQVPAWLDKEEALNGARHVVLHHDADYFKPIAGPDILLSGHEIQQWKDAAIPSFNSLAVEAQIHNINNTKSDQLVYFNDDFFSLRKLAISDYTTPLYGPVIKTLTRITSRYVPAEDTLYRSFNPAGEEVGIKRAAWVLGRRFSMRPYYYFTHHPRTLWLPLLLEAAQTFPEAFSDTPLSRFRAQSDVPTPVQTVFLGSWYIVERHREALLWTWAVAKWGGRAGTMTSKLKDLMWSELAEDSSSSNSVLNVCVPTRDPVENVDLFATANVDVPTSTEYSFSSKDGYALSYVESMWSWNRPRHGYPDLTQGLIEDTFDVADTIGATHYMKDPSFTGAKACSIVRWTCFGSLSKTESASDFFKRIAFDQPKCGDCIIVALIGASGTSGIDKFLPSFDIKIASDEFEGSAGPPHLPLTSDWMTTDFSMPRAIPKTSAKPDMTLRTWCTRLIQRYSYVLGSVESDFYKVEWASKLESKLEKVQRSVEEDSTHIGWESSLLPSQVQDRWRHRMGENGGPLAFLCLNDDIRESGELRNRVDHILESFFRRMWTVKMSFESVG